MLPKEAILASKYNYARSLIGSLNLDEVFRVKTGILTLWLTRSSLIFIFLAASLTDFSRISANECGYCEEDDFGVSLSNGVGGRNFIIGGALVLGGIAAILAASSSHHHHHHSSRNGSISNNAGGEGEVNPILNPNVGGTPATIATNTANQAMNNADTVAGVGVPLTIQTTGITPINTVTTQGGATVDIATQNGGGTLGGFARAAAFKKNGHSSKCKGKGNCQTGMCQASHSSTHEEQTKVDFKVKVTGPSAGALVLIPFVISPDGKIVEGAPFTARVRDHSVQAAPITLFQSNKGTYRAGVRVMSANVLAPMNIHLENAIFGSREHAVEVIEITGSHLEQQLMHEFNF